MVNSEFKPTEIWTPRSDNFELGEAIDRARYEINRKDPDRLIDELKSSVRRSDNGVVYTVLMGDHPEEYSETDALVMFNPFANTGTSNMLVRAEFIREVAKNADVRDQNGKLKPVIMLASPGIRGSRPKLSGDEKNKIRNGNLGPAIKEFLAAVSALEYGKVALLGFSFGADMAVSGASHAYDANLDITELSVGEPAAVETRSRPELGIDFIKSGGQFQESISEGGLKAQKKAIGKNNFSLTRILDYARFGIVSLTPTNRALWSYLGHNLFERQLQEIFDNGTVDRTVVAYGSRSHIAKTSSIEPQLARLHSLVGDNRLTSIKVEGKDHSWGDQLPLLAKLYLRALA